MSRILGFMIGAAVHAVFGVMVWYLYWFLKGEQTGADAEELRFVDVGLDAGLALQFVVVHSLLLYPAIRERLTAWIAVPFYGLFYCVATTLGLSLAMALWRTSSIVLWRFDGAAEFVVEAAFFGSWVLLFYSFFLNGVGYQTGWTPWWHWLRGRPVPPRPFHPRGIFRIMRHPAYLSFLGLLWFTPVMTADRAVLTAIWTVYVFIGSYLKDRRLLSYVGEPYRRYMAEVPGYPGVLFGPLGRTPREFGL